MEACTQSQFYSSRVRVDRGCFKISEKTHGRGECEIRVRTNLPSYHENQGVANEPQALPKIFNKMSYLWTNGCSSSMSKIKTQRHYGQDT